MKDTDKFKKCFWISFLIFTAVYVFLAVGFPNVIAYLFDQEKYDVLNVLSGVSQNYPLDYYQGQIENRLIGPIKFVISGALFTGFAWLYLLNVNTWAFSVSVFIYYLLTRPEVLFFPPFGEALTAPFYDVIWLIRNNLDYLELQRQETFTTGGPLVYPTSLWPLAVAGIMKLIPSTKVFIFFMHLLYFAFGAGIIAVARSIYLKFFDKRLAMLGSILLLSLPINQAIVELINMEVPCVFFSILAVYALLNRKMAWAFLWAVIGLFMKSPAGSVCVVVFLCGCLLFFIEEDKRKKWSALGWGGLTLIFTVVKFIIRSEIIGTQTPNNTVSLFIGWTVLLKMPLTWIFIAMVICISTIIIRNFKFSQCRSFFNRYYGVIVLVMISASWFALYLNFSVMSPRYKPLLAPFLLFCIFFSVFHIIKNKVVQSVGMVLAILISFSCAFGWHHSRYVAPGPYGYNWLERSLEYRNMLKLQMKIANIIETDFKKYIIGAPHVTAQSLSFGRMGYINKPPEVMVYATRGILGVRNLIPVTPVVSRNVIWVGFTSLWLNRQNLIKEGEDIIIRNIWVGDRHAVLFTGGYEIEEMRQEMVKKSKLLSLLNKTKRQ